MSLKQFGATVAGALALYAVLMSLLWRDPSGPDAPAAGRASPPLAAADHAHSARSLGPETAGVRPAPVATGPAARSASAPAAAAEPGPVSMLTPAPAVPSRRTEPVRPAEPTVRPAERRSAPSPMVGAASIHVDSPSWPAEIATVDPFADDRARQAHLQRTEFMNRLKLDPAAVAQRLRVEPEDVERVARGERPLPELWVERWWQQEAN